MAKNYDYDAVMDFCKDGGTLDNSLAVMQEKLKALRICTNECEELLHGIGTESAFYKQYKKIYDSIGQSDGVSSGSGAWQMAAIIRAVNTKIYQNAEEDKRIDEEEQAAATANNY